MLAFKKWQHLGAADQHQPAAGLVDGPAHSILQAACALCDFIQCRSQLAAPFTAVRRGEALPCH